MQTIYFVGTGPGDPELLTRKAVQVIEQADIIFYLDNKGNNRALDTIDEFIKEKPLQALSLPMGKITAKDYDQAVQVILEGLGQYTTGVFVTIGDPMIYSTAVYLMDRIDPNQVQMQVISGIPSFVAAAATTQMPLTTKGESFCLCDRFREEVLDTVDSVAFLKTMADKKDMLDTLEERGYAYHYAKDVSNPKEWTSQDKKEICQDKAYISLILARKKREDIRFLELKNKS